MPGQETVSCPGFLSVNDGPIRLRRPRARSASRLPDQKRERPAAPALCAAASRARSASRAPAPGTAWRPRARSASRLTDQKEGTPCGVRTLCGRFAGALSFSRSGARHSLAPAGSLSFSPPAEKGRACPWQALPFCAKRCRPTESKLSGGGLFCAKRFALFRREARSLASLSRYFFFRYFWVSMATASRMIAPLTMYWTYGSMPR